MSRARSLAGLSILGLSPNLFNASQAAVAFYEELDKYEHNKEDYR